MLEFSSKTDQGGNLYSAYAAGDLTPPEYPIQGTIWGLSMYQLVETTDPEVIQTFSLRRLWKFSRPIEVQVPTLLSRGRWVCFDHVAACVQLQISQIPERLQLIRSLMTVVPHPIASANVPDRQQPSPNSGICCVHRCEREALHNRTYQMIGHCVCGRHRKTYPLDLKPTSVHPHVQAFEEELGMPYVSGIHFFMSVANGPVIPITLGTGGNLIVSCGVLHLVYRQTRERLLAIHEGSKEDDSPVYFLSAQGRMYSLYHPRFVESLRSRFPNIRWVQTGGTPL